MNRDPLGLGVLLYGFRVPAGQPTNLTLLAAGWHMDGLAVREFELAHEGCSLSTFCRNPLHPGPCKGWRKKLGVEAPGALKALKKAEGESLAKRRAKVAEAKSAAGKKTAGIASPLHAKKATAKHANVLLGNSEAKAHQKAAKVILNKQEIKKYSKIKAAHMNSIRTKHGLTEDPGLEDRIAEALAKDNTTGHDENYRAAIGGSAASLGAQLADKHCKKGDGDCDGIAFEQLRETLSDAAETALLTGDDSELDTALDDYAAGKTPKASKPPAAAAPRPAPAPEPKAAPEPPAAEPDTKIPGTNTLDVLASANMWIKNKADYEDLSDEDQAKVTAAIKAHPDSVIAKHLADLAGISLTSKPKDAPAPISKAKGTHTPPTDPGSTPANKTIGNLSDEQLVNAVTMMGSEDGVGKDAADELTRRGLGLDGNPKAEPPAAPGAPEAPAAPASNAEKAQVGMKFGLGLMALTKGNKTLGTKAQQKHFADRAQAEMDGDPAAQGVIKFGAEKIAQGMMIKATKHPFAHPTPKLSLKEQDVIQGLAAEEIAQGIKGEPGPFPVTESLKKAVAAWHAKDYAAMTEANAEFQQHIKAATAKKIGVSPDSSAAVIAAHILFKPGLNMADGKTGVRAQVLGEMSSAEYVGLPEGHKIEIKQWLDGRAEYAVTTHDPKVLADTKAIQRKLGLPEHAGELPSTAPSHSPAQTDALAMLTNNAAPDAEVHATYDALPKDEFDALDAKDQKHIIADLDAIVANNAGDSSGIAQKAKVTKAYLKGEPAPPEPAPVDSPSVGKAKAAFTHGGSDHNANAYEKLSALEGLDEAGLSELPLGMQMRVHDFLEHQEKLYGKGTETHQEITDLQAKFGFSAVPAAPPKTHLDKLKEMFGEDGDPNHNEVVKGILGMTKKDWDGLTPAEKSNVVANIDDAKGNGEPGSLSADDKIDVYLSADKEAADAAAGPKFPNGTAPATVVSTSPDAKAASNYATGAVSGTAKQKLTAYEKVSGAEFEQLTPVEQKAILDDLDAIGSKFLDPKKVAQAKKQKDYLSGYTGGGSGAGGPLDATSAPALTDQTKAQMGANTVSEMLDAIGVGIPDPITAKAEAAKILTGAAKNGNYATMIGPMADLQASMGMDALSKKHVDLDGSPLFDAAATAAIKPELAKDVAKKLAGDAGPTPVYAAWLKAMKSGSAQDAQDVADAAFPPFGGTFGGPGPAPLEDKAKLTTTLAKTWEQAGLGTTPMHAPMGGDLTDEVNHATHGGWASPGHVKWAQQTAEAQGHTMVDSAFLELGFSSSQKSALPSGLTDKVATAVAEDFEDQLLHGGGTGTGAAYSVEKAVKDVYAASSQAAIKNGWNQDSLALKDFQTALLQAKLEEIVDKYKPKVKPAWNAPIVYPNGAAAPLGDPITSGSMLNSTQQGVAFSAYKSAHKGTVLAHSNEDIYNNLLAVASHYAGEQPTSAYDGGEFPDDLSVLDVAKSVDISIAGSLGQVNQNVLTNRIAAWAASPEGQQYIKDHPQAGQKWIDNLAGEGAGSKEAAKIGLKIGDPVGKRAQKPKTKPPKYDATKTAADFQPLTAQQMQGGQQQYMDDHDVNWTPGQAESLSNYTTGSYHELNAYLRGKHANGAVVDSISSIGLERVALIQAGMRPLQQDTLLKRGTGWEFLPEEFQSPEGVRKLIGKTFTDDAFMSTTVGGEGGHFEHKPVLLMIEAPKGTPGAWVNHISHNSGENEVVLAAGSKYKVLSVSDGAYGATTIRIRVVP